MEIYFIHIFTFRDCSVVSYTMSVSSLDLDRLHQVPS